MPYSKTAFFLQAFLCFCLSLAAQRARYTDEYKKVYDFKIAGYLKNVLHAWSADVSPARMQNTEITLTLHIFSADMRPISEHTVSLGKVMQWDIDFQMENNFYYASIVYVTNKHRSFRLLKVDPAGNMTDVSSSPELWKKASYPRGNGRLYAMAQQKNNVFVALTQTVPVNDSLETGAFLRLPREADTSSEVLEKLVVRKVNMATKEWVFQVFGSKRSRFYRPMIHVTDSSVLVAAMTEQKKELTGRGARPGPLLFIAKLDTSLTDSSSKMTLLKSTNGKKDETYSPFELFPIQNKIAIFSSGLYQRETYYFAPGGGASGQVTVPRVLRSYFINSLKITLVDDKSNLLKDTIIEKKYGDMQWDNFFSASSTKSIDLFCMRKYKGNKNGITRFSINGDGGILEEDMIVDIKNEYQLSLAKEITPGVLVMPFTRKGRTGLVRLEYQPLIN